MATNKTRIKIRHGSTFPSTEPNGLLPYELGWDGTNLALYINNNGTIRKVGGEGLFLPLTGGTLSGPVINNFNNNSVGRHLTDLCHSYLGNSATGTIKITLPNTTSNMVMMVIRIILYTYNSDSGKELIISGYTYNDSTWYNYQATALGGKMAQTIRLAYDGTHYCILLGATNTVWSFTSVQLADVYSSYGAQPTSGYSISLITSESGYTVTATVGHALVIGNGGTGATTAADARANLGTWSLVSDSYNTFMPADGTTNGWYKFGTSNTSYGILPSAAGGAGSGHNYIGTSSWYWKYAYIDEIHGTLKGNATGLVDGSSTMTSAYNKAGLNYADYSWLAGWNGYELRAVAKTQFAQASHNHYQLITEGDNRSVATTPNSYNNNLVFRGLKTNSAFGSPSSDTYSYVVGLRGWSDSSGGNAYELAFNNTGIYCRKGATTSWGSWDKIVTLSDGNSAYVKKAGDTMSGNLIIAKTAGGVVYCQNTGKGTEVQLTADSSAGNHGVWSTGYYNGSAFTSGGKWIIYRGSDGEGHTGLKLYGAVWNDYAEYRICKENPEPGRCIVEVGDDSLRLSTSRMQRAAHIVSDTFGFAIGKTDKCKTPVAVSGRVLAYIYEGREAAREAIGRPVCSGPNGTVSIMTDEEYKNFGYCAIGTISAVPEYEKWGEKDEEVDVNGRIWIKVY